ncbi:MAG TPA: M28 family peptidase [Methylomirabilota bacterium]|jgi:Zn-dependent M28 family amino/carboxypeptidase|nr:M28 family peptidase [Methylomirabilota bacterium]
MRRRTVTLRELGFFLRGRINSGLSRALNRRRGPPLAPIASLEEVLSGPQTPLGLARLVVGRSNPDREASLSRYLERRGIPFTRQAFATFEGRGENLSVEVGSGDRVLVLIAHHDAVPGSPGANDNAAGLGILLHLLGPLLGAPPSGLRVRFLFTACEELGYLGARAYVKETPLADVAGVLSLELCGIGDAVVIWDVEDSGAFVQNVTRALERLGRRRDETYHVVGRIPVFGSDHRAFAAAGIPAFGLSMVPVCEADALRRFVLSPGRSALRQLVHRPRPFDTYHTSRDTYSSLEPGACEAVVAALDAIVSELR